MDTYPQLFSRSFQMRQVFFFSLIALLPALCVRADAINYDRIPSDVTGYAMGDVGRLLSSQLIRHSSYSPTMIKQVTAQVGENADITMYTTNLNKTPGVVILMHSRAQQLRNLVNEKIKTAKSDIRIVYQQQEIHFTSGAGLLDSFVGQPTNHATTRATATVMQMQQTGKTPHTFSLGLGGGGADGSDSFLYKGDAYIAFVGDDLIIASGDLPSMAEVIDVIQARKASLAKEDPQGIRIEPPAGVIFLGAGLTAAFIENSPEDKGTQPPVGHLGGNGFGLDLFGSLKAKARIGRFDLGENQNQMYADGVFTMDDADAALQLKNLITGVKALVSLTQADAQPLITPLQISTADKNVVLHWSWPNDKLPELYRLSQSHHDGAIPTH